MVCKTAQFKQICLIIHLKRIYKINSKYPALFLRVKSLVSYINITQVQRKESIKDESELSILQQVQSN